MDKLTRYANLVKDHISKIAGLCERRPQSGVDTLCVFDDTRHHYMLVSTGWTKNHRVRGATLFVRLRDDKIWIEEDWTEDGIGAELLRAGVPKSDIVLAFHHPDQRKHTEFAVA